MARAAEVVLQLRAENAQYLSRLRQSEQQLGRSLGNIQRQAGATGAFMRTTFAGLFAGLSLAGVQNLTEAATRIDNSLKVAGLSGAELERVYGRLRDSAIKNATPLEALVELYGRASLVQKELGISGEELLNFTDKIAVALRVSGKTAAESSGALLQLSQALGSGTVRAEEFNSILEGALPIAQAAAAGLKEAGGSVAALRQLVVDGKVSSEAFFRAFEAGSVILEEKVANAQLTFNQALGNMQTALIDTAREFNNSTGAADRFATGINNAAQGIAKFDVSGFIEQLRSAYMAVEQFMQNAGNSGFFEWLAEWSTGREITLGRPIDLETLDVEKKIANVERQIAMLQERIALNTELGFDTTEAELQLAALVQKATAAKAAIASAATPRGYQTGTPGDPNALAQRATTGPAVVKPVSLGDFAAPPSRGGSSGGSSRAKAIKDDFKATSDGFAEMIGYTREYQREQDAANRRLDRFASIAQSAGSSLATALADGKLEASELLQILAQVAAQLLSMGNGAGGGIGGVGGSFLSGILGSVFHHGGEVGKGGQKRSVSPLAFSGARRMHSGGFAGLRAGEVPAILQKGELVLPKNLVGRARGGGQPQAITITLVGEEGEIFTPRVQQISGQTAGVVVREARPQLSRDAVSSVQSASRNRPGIFR